MVELHREGSVPVACAAGLFSKLVGEKYPLQKDSVVKIYEMRVVSGLLLFAQKWSKSAPGKTLIFFCLCKHTTYGT